MYELGKFRCATLPTEEILSSLPSKATLTKIFIIPLLTGTSREGNRFQMKFLTLSRCRFCRNVSHILFKVAASL